MAIIIADNLGSADMLLCICSGAEVPQLGSGFRLVKLGNKSLVQSVPGELNQDKNAALNLAQSKGYTSQEELMHSLRWSETRASETLLALLKEGLAMLDNGAADGKPLTWFPCLQYNTQAAVPG